MSNQPISEVTCLHAFDHIVSFIDQNNVFILVHIMTQLKYKALVMSGGGSLGIMYSGALRVLEELHILSGIKCFAGTSIGALMGCCLALGYTSEELSGDFETLSLANLRRSSYSVTTAYNCFHSLGMYAIDTISELIKKRVAGKAELELLSFQQLYAMFGTELHITACNVSTGRTEYFSMYTTPDMPVATAVCMSMCMPLMFQPVAYKGALYVDGATFGHHAPVHFHGNDKWHVLTLQLQPSWYKSVFSKPDVDTFVAYVGQLLRGMYESLAKAKSATTSDTITLEYDIDMLAETISAADRTAMIHEGVHATKTFFDFSGAI